jgi:hypothetical protein
MSLIDHKDPSMDSFYQLASVHVRVWKRKPNHKHFNESQNSKFKANQFENKKTNSNSKIRKPLLHILTCYHFKLCSNNEVRKKPKTL